MHVEVSFRQMIKDQSDQCPVVCSAEKPRSTKMQLYINQMSDLSRAIAANREARKIAKMKAAAMCRTLSVGQSFTIDIPTGEPARSDTYRAISRVAFGILGKGQLPHQAET